MYWLFILWLRENVVNLKTIITVSVVIVPRQLSPDFITLKELHNAEHVISWKASTGTVLLSAADCVGNVYGGLIQLSVLIDCQAALSLLASSLLLSASMLQSRPLLIALVSILLSYCRCQTCLYLSWLSSLSFFQLFLVYPSVHISCSYPWPLCKPSVLLFSSYFYSAHIWNILVFTSRL